MKSLIKIKNNTYTKPNNNNKNISTKQISIIDTKYNTVPEIKIENSNYTVPINEIKNKETNIISTDNIQQNNSNINLTLDTNRIIPTGELIITKNGIYNVFNYSSTRVNVKTPGEYYDGEYIITPNTRNNVVLNTSNKIVEDNITIKKIEFLETHNAYGTTVYIG